MGNNSGGETGFPPLAYSVKTWVPPAEREEYESEAGEINRLGCGVTGARRSPFQLISEELVECMSPLVGPKLEDIE